MPDRNPAPPLPRERLRQQWLQHAAASFDRMFADDQQDLLVTFDQREDRAIALGQDLAAWLLEEHTAADPDARPAQTPACPKCGQPGQRVGPPDAALAERQLTTDTGDVGFRREQWRCTACRVVFFPPGPEVGPGHRGL
jgi:hypothetical protein